MGSKKKRLRHTFCLDTNIYREFARRDIRLPEDLRRRTTLSYITYFELISQLQSCPRSDFPEIQKAVQLAWQHGKRRFLPSPTEFIDQVLFKRSSSPSYVRHSRKGLNLAVRVKSWNSRTQLIKMQGRSYQLADFTKERKTHQQAWINTVARFRDEAVQHTSLPIPRLGGPITGQDAPSVNQFTRCSQWRQLYAKAVVGNAVEAHNGQLLARTTTALDAAACFLGEVVRSVFVDGYRFERNANDCFDHLQLQYLCREDMVFVTNESALRRRISHSSQLSRVISLDDWMNSQRPIEP